ncbi:hypothetical protein LOTGIDRAFT_69813, partial [Lottia gigantea]
YFRYPLKDPERLKKWLVNLKRVDFEPTKNTILCSRHFEEQCFLKTLERTYLKDDAVPTIF